MDLHLVEKMIARGNPQTGHIDCRIDSADCLSGAAPESSATSVCLWSCNIGTPEEAAAL